MNRDETAYDSVAFYKVTEIERRSTLHASLPVDPGAWLDSSVTRVIDARVENAFVPDAVAYLDLRKKSGWEFASLLSCICRSGVPSGVYRVHIWCYIPGLQPAFRTSVRDQNARYVCSWPRIIYTTQGSAWRG
jgi:hypothetical protein